MSKKTSPPDNPPEESKPDLTAERAKVDAAIAALPGDYTDPDYVVEGMRAHFGELFTDTDETRVRELVKVPPPKATTASATAGKVEKGAAVEVLDWSKDPQAPTVCKGTIAAVNADGSVDVDVQAPAGVEPYTQSGLAQSTSGEFVPGQWRWPQPS